MFVTFRQDLAQTFPAPFTWRTCVTAFFQMPVWAVGIFRFGKRAQAVRFGLLRMVLLAVHFLLYKISEVLSGIQISIRSEIGPGLVVHNFGGVLIQGRLGRNCTIVQGAQLISRSDGKDSGWPTLGENVYVGSGAKVLCNVQVGNNVRIGANAVVMADVPDDSLVMPPESKVIRGFYRRKAAPDEPAAAE